MIAKRISVINPYALRAEPSIVADDVDPVPIVAVRTPPFVGAVLLRRINTITTLPVAPTVLVGTGFGL